MSFDWKIGVIEDGLDQPGYVAEEFGLHPECRFVYRPMSAEEYEAFDAKANKESPERSRIMVGVLLSKKIRSWSLTDSKGNPAPVNELNCRSMRSLLQIKVYQIIAGMRATDVDPKSVAPVAGPDFKTLEELSSVAEKLGN